MTKPNLNPLPESDHHASSRKDSPASSFLELCREFAQHGDANDGAFGLSGEAIATFRNDVVPRLMLIHSERLQEVAGQQAISPADETAFLNTLLSGSLSENATFLEQLRLRRRVSEAELLEFLGATARRLGTLWEEDEGSFAEVSIALCRLHHFLRELSEEAGHRPLPTRDASSQPSILFANAEGDQHIFGVMVVAEMFRRDGWAVSCSPGAETEMLCAELAETSVDVIGLSVSQVDLLPKLTVQCATLRAASRNTDVRIIIGGIAAETAKHDPASIGADAIVGGKDNPTAIGRHLLAISACAC